MSLRSLIKAPIRWWRTPAIKRTIVVSVLVVTIGLFIHYFTQHPAYWHQLGTVSPWTVVWVLLLNALMVIVLTALGITTIALCGRRISLRENFLLTAYSSLANFFGPLQSGPGVRAAYLKTRHQVRLRDYTLASLLVLGLYAFFSALFLLVGTRPWWQTTLVLLAVAGFSAYVIRFFQLRDKKRSESNLVLQPRILAAIVILVFVQVVITVAWYYVELKAVNPHIRFSQAMSYAGAANFALFVSITPDAVGIREGFLVLSQHIHHVANKDIVSANVIDRAVYVVFLGLLFLLVLGMHAKDKLQLTKLRRQVASGDEQ